MNVIKAFVLSICLELIQNEFMTEKYCDQLQAAAADGKVNEIIHIRLKYLQAFLNFKM